MIEPLHIVCPHCETRNRVAADRPAQEAKCGKCHRNLFEGTPLTLMAGNFDRHIQGNDIPVLVDFWAPWCSPCKAMAPFFEEAARQLRPRVRVAKVNTEQEPGLSSRFGISSIPTLVLFKNGREVARISGAIGLSHLLAWTFRHI